MKFMKQSIVFLLLLLPVFVEAQLQQDRLNSLHQALKNAANDSIRMDAYYKLAQYYNEINRDSTLYYLAKGIPISQKLELKLYEAHMLENQGYILGRLGNYPKALESFLQALKIAEDPASEKYAWNLPNGTTPRNERLNRLGVLYLTMGHLYGSTNNPNKQISNYHKSIVLADSVQNSDLLVLANMNLGRVYLQQNQLDSALLFQQTALAHCSEHGI